MKPATFIATIFLATAAYAGPVVPPPGAVQFCVRNNSYCVSHPPASASLSDRQTIIAINDKVNKSILPDPLATDEAKRAENRNWRTVMPGGVGACNEYALTKEQLLAWAGIPMGAMQITEVRIPETGELHMVLLVRIGGALNVLDNRTPAIFGPEETRYEFLAKQDGWGWVTAGDLK